MKGQIRVLLAFGPAALALAMVPIALAHGSHATATIVTVTAGKPSSYRFTLSPKTFPHGKVTFKVTNKDSTGIGHDFKWCTAPVKNASADACTGKDTGVLGEGGTATFTVTIPKAGTYEFLCAQPGHAASGMKGIVKVT